MYTVCSVSVAGNRDEVNIFFYCKKTNNATRPEHTGCVTKTSHTKSITQNTIQGCVVYLRLLHTFAFLLQRAVTIPRCPAAAA